MKRIIAVIVTLALLLIAPAGRTVKAESLYVNKVVSVVYDDSGSMTGMGANWAYANYAMQTFCGLLNEGDQLYVTYMSDPFQSYSLTDMNRQDAVDMLSNHSNSSGTPFDAVTTAYDRIETPPYMPPSVLDKLDTMYLQFSGGVTLPSGTVVTSTDASPSPDPDPTGVAQTGVASNLAIFEQILRTAVCDTAASVTVQVLGFTIDSDTIIEIMESIFESEMIRYMCIDSYQMSICDEPSGDQTVTIVFDYSLPISEIKRMKTETEDAAKKLVDDLGLASMSSIDAVTTLNQYLCDNAYYSTSDPFTPADYTAYGALVKGVCVCDGYARATQYVYELCNISGIYIHGSTPAGLHAWNLVNIDGSWYHLDTTWNDGDPPSYTDYFLVTDDYMSVSRTWDKGDYPATPSTNYS